MKPITQKLAASLAALPEQITLTVRREGSPEAQRHYFPATDPGCWIACAPCAGIGGAWGRSEKSAEDAIRACLKAGGRPLAKSTEPQITLCWQPAEAWIEHAKIYPERAGEVGPPRIAADGATCWWGSPAPCCVFAPSAGASAQRAAIRRRRAEMREAGWAPTGVLGYWSDDHA